MAGTYVYIYLNPLKKGNFIYEDLNFEYEPFYVGKGVKNRFKAHIWLAKHYPNTGNKHKLSTINKILKNGLEPLILFINTDNDDESKSIEMLYIKKIGRSDLKLGPLTNLTDGGEGSINRKLSADAIKSISEKAKIRNKGSNNPRYGVEVKPETREKIRKGNLGKKYSNEVNKSKGLPGEKNPMYGKSVFDLWVERYGIEEAKIRHRKREEKRFETLKRNKNAK